MCLYKKIVLGRACDYAWVLIGGFRNSAQTHARQDCYCTSTGAGGKPSTWFPPEGLVEHFSTFRPTNQKKKWADRQTKTNTTNKEQAREQNKQINKQKSSSEHPKQSKENSKTTSIKRATQHAQTDKQNITNTHTHTHTHTDA